MFAAILVSQLEKFKQWSCLLTTALIPDVLGVSHESEHQIRAPGQALQPTHSRPSLSYIYPYIFTLDTGMQKSAGSF